MAKQQQRASSADETEGQATSEVSTSSAPADTNAPWAPPNADQEFEFTGDLGALPAWADKGWAGADSDGPTLNVPMIDYPAKDQPMRQQPYHTSVAKKGDTVKWVEKKRRFEIVKAEPKEEEGEAA